MKVKNMENKNGRAIPNQFIIYDDTVEIFQSYNSIIVKEVFYLNCGKSEVFLDEKYWNYSRTTSKYRNQFLNETTKETEKKIKDGTYKLVNLN